VGADVKAPHRFRGLKTMDGDVVFFLKGLDCIEDQRIIDLFYVEAPIGNERFFGQSRYGKKLFCLQ
jgi:hypothetical protein